MALEKIVVTECLHMYKELPCLWDTEHEDYSCKIKRNIAFQTILAKYKEIDEDATLYKLKKKVENWRTAYKREYKKTLNRGNDEKLRDYIPQLWYYNLLTFLNGSVNDKEEIGEPTPAKRKPLPTMYLPQHEESSNDEDTVDNLSDQQTYEDVDRKPVTQAALQIDAVPGEPESFGTTVGLQLKELDAMQRTIAEKLISDVIFNGRLNNLTVDSRLLIGKTAM